ncbi:MAG: cation-translocating P-type ATPase [Ruminococcus flavefaciens]|nr:cation-translocating P-type ATPase [Ruminococcus flavefaciens]MCM1229747.1 cation-translocating P-type ATPase [Ruminococcus flavefaciens]
MSSTKQPERLQPSAEKGLTSAQAKERRNAGLSNIPPEPPSKSVWEIIADNTFTYFNMIFVILACLIIYAGTYRDLTFLPIIIANTLIGIIQELRSKKVLDKLSMMNAPETAVIRDGKEISLPSKDVVLDDIAIFRAGNQISADAVIIDGSVAVNESLLTGESDEIYKSEGDNLMSGSFIVSGSCRARLEKVGADSYISRLTAQAKKSKKGEQSEMIRSLNRIVKIAGIAIIPIGILLFCQQHFLELNDVSSSIQAMVAAVIGMIPEGLFLLASTTLAVSTLRLAGNKVLVHDMKCIETLARVDVLCVDKTGTITEGKMSVMGVIPVGDSAESELVSAISDFASAQSADNATMIAVKNYFHTPTGQKIKSCTGFSSEFKYSSTMLESGAFVLGAPEFILRDRVSEYDGIISAHSRKGMRVLVFGRYNGIPDGKELTAETEPLCFVLIANPIRKNAPETFRFFAEQGVEIKVISGDNPVTVSEIANQAGIANAGNYIDASTLKTDEAIENAVVHYTVFGRVTPEQKRKFVRALKKAGRTVAMTGDGVNDVLALKSADCSVAMASGSEAAAQASQLVLLESDFSKMPDVVMEGRKVVNNLERSGSLFLVKNIFSLLMSVISIFFGITYPLKPAHISLISAFTIGLPGLCLSQIPNRDLIKGNFMTNILLKALPAGITDAIVVVAMVIFGNIFSSAQDDISTASTILMSVVGMMILFRISQPMNAVKWAIWIICGLLLTFSMIFLGGFFNISGMSVQCILLCVNFSIIAEPVFRYLTLITQKIKKNG